MCNSGKDLVPGQIGEKRTWQFSRRIRFSEVFDNWCQGHFPMNSLRQLLSISGEDKFSKRCILAWSELWWIWWWCCGLHHSIFWSLSPLNLLWLRNSSLMMVDIMSLNVVLDFRCSFWRSSGRNHRRRRDDGEAKTLAESWFRIFASTRATAATRVWNLDELRPLNAFLSFLAQEQCWGPHATQF